MKIIMKTSIVCEFTLDEIITALTEKAKTTEKITIGGSHVDFEYEDDPDLEHKAIIGAKVTFNGKSNPAI
jgi:hypothetical protein